MTTSSLSTNLTGPLPAPGHQRPLMHAGGLVWTLVRTDFKTRYHGTIGGFVWALLKPFTMFAVLLAVFSWAFASDPTYRLNLILGLFLYDFFGESTKTGLLSLHSKGYLLTKARFPSWILVITSIANALITLLIFSVVIFAFLTLSRGAPRPVDVLLYLVYIAALLLIVAGIALAGSVLFLRYRDLNQIWEVVVQAGFFVAPVIYPLNIIPERFHFYLYLWPPTPVIQFARSVLVAGAVPTFRAHLMLACVTAVIFGGGVLIYRRRAPRAAEYL
jgi:ABC-type polysaccharide/polyol phosphate export permease